MKLFNQPSMVLLEQSLNAASLRQNVLSHNIANAQTPGYKRMDVRFETELQKALQNQAAPFTGKRTDVRHILISSTKRMPVRPTMIQETNHQMNHNGNNVDLDYEMAELAKNALRYQVLAQQMSFSSEI